jgi:hypothetical protein
MHVADEITCDEAWLSLEGFVDNAENRQPDLARGLRRDCVALAGNRLRREEGWMKQRQSELWHSLESSLFESL